jgi:transcriptional regulator with XRE-family HTH domain
MRTRILEFLKSENKSSAQLAEEIGVQPSGISHIISGRNNPSLDFVIKMLGKYPSLSTDWLLFGKGEMYRDARMKDLFSAEADNIDLNIVDNIASRGARQQDVPFLNETTDHPSLKQIEKSDKVNRIVFFFGDGTFKDYLPG